MDAFETAGIAVITAVLAVTVRQYRPELALQASIAGGTVLLLVCLSKLSGIADAVRELFESAPLSGGWASMFLKTAGIAYITEIAAEICRDAGESALAVKTELCGKALMLGCALPAAAQLLKILLSLLSYVE